MTTLNEQMQERMDSRPDKHTLAWWDSQFAEVVKGYRGLTHAANLALAEIEDRDVVVKALQEKVDLQAAELHEANAALGLIRADVIMLQESLEKARVAYANLKTVNT